MNTFRLSEASEANIEAEVRAKEAKRVKPAFFRLI
jgi:hypothetical protein